jgi:hypothetical protein
MLSDIMLPSAPPAHSVINLQSGNCGPQPVTGIVDVNINTCSAMPIALPRTAHSAAATDPPGNGPSASAASLWTPLREAAWLIWTSE